MHFFVFAGIGFVIFIIGLSFHAQLPGQSENSPTRNVNTVSPKKNDDFLLNLSSRETKRRLRIFAENVDTDKDGFVDFDELLTHVNQTLVKIEMDESDDQFEDADVNEDGYVTWSEHKRFQKRQLEDDEDDEDDDEDDQDSTKPYDQEVIDPIDDRQDFLYFQAADVDKDGKLSRGEYEALKSPEKHERMHAALVETTLQEKDKNSDGFLDFEEFKQEKVTDEPESEWLAAEKARFKELYDKNQDGKLDRDEMRLWLIPDTYEMADQETRHLIAEADKDKDGKLSYKEILDEYAMFAQSEATKFGDLLEEMVEEHDEL